MGAGGGSSAMPQKQNPVDAVLIRSAALRAPGLAAQLHLAAGLAVDERPDGAWHAEWPALQRPPASRPRRLRPRGRARGGPHLRCRRAPARNLDLTGGLIVSERLGIVLVPLIGKARFDALIADASAGGDLSALVAALPEASALDIAALLDPAQYVGLAPRLVDAAVHRAVQEGIARDRSRPSPSPPRAARRRAARRARPVARHLDDPVGGRRSRPRGGVPRDRLGPPRTRRSPAARRAVLGGGARRRGAPIEPSGEPFRYAGVSLGGAVGLSWGCGIRPSSRRAAIVASGAQLGEPAGWHERAAQVRATSTSSLIVGSAQRWFAPDSIARRPELSGRLLHVLQDADDESYALCCEALAGVRRAAIARRDRDAGARGLGRVRRRGARGEVRRDRRRRRLRLDRARSRMLRTSRPRSSPWPWPRCCSTSSRRHDATRQAKDSPTRSATTRAWPCAARCSRTRTSTARRRPRPS